MNVKVYPHEIKLETTEVNAGEYNITPVHFEFSEEYEELTKMAVFTTCSGVSIKTSILNNECRIPFEVLAEPGQVLLGVYGYETHEDELELRYSPKAEKFVVNKGSYREGNDPDLPEPTEWEQVLKLINQAITETNNLNIDVNKEEHITTITLTKKDGTQKVVQVEDGKSLEFNWRGTELGVRVEGESQYEYVNLKGDKGDAGAIKMQIVETLPQTGQDDTIYLVPLEHPDIQENNYAEYIWVNNQWELLGKIGVQVDLTDYYTKTETNTLLDKKQPLIDNNNKLSASLVSGLSSVATSGSYNDLINKPDLSGYELSSNKVVSISSSSTDTQYPSAKCVYDLVGDINTALDTINGEVI